MRKAIERILTMFGMQFDKAEQGLHRAHPHPIEAVTDKNGNTIAIKVIDLDNLLIR